MAIIVSELNYYPVKSCAGIGLTTASIGARGVELDREWAIISAKPRKDEARHDVLTQRQAPTLCLIKASIKSEGNDPSSVCLEVEGHGRIEVPVSDGKEFETVFAWGPVCRGLDQGEDAANWLSAYLQKDCRLLRFSPSYVRNVDREIAKRETDQTGFADDCPFLLLSEESLQDLNTHLPEALPMNRFRPNIVVKGVEPYAEDQWKIIRIGNVVFDVLQQCGRCVITTVDQSNGSKGMEPLHSLAKLRNVNNKLMFGVHLAHHNNGAISVNDVVEVLQ